MAVGFGYGMRASPDVIPGIDEEGDKEYPAVGLGMRLDQPAVTGEADETDA